MSKRKFFTVNLYGYLDLDKAKVCRDYQEQNKKVIEDHDALSHKYEYTQIDSDESIDELVNNEKLTIFSIIPNKYKYQLISDIVRYKYMMSNPDSIYVDTDFCMFGPLALEVLNAMSDSANKTGIDLLCGEINKNRIFPCNWLMIGSGNKNGIYKDLYSTLIHRLSIPEYEDYESTGKFGPSKIENYIWDRLWGYAVPMTLDSRKFSFIPYEYFQACEWNKSWKDPNVMKRDQIVGCHFFGFGEDGRPDWKEFIEYHKLEENCK